MTDITMREMLEAGVHFGHQTRYWNPRMEPYLFGRRNKIHIIDLEKSLPMYKDAANFIGKLASQNKTIMFVGTKRNAQNAIREAAMRCEMPFVNRRWLGGLLTNHKTVKQSIKRMKNLVELKNDGTLERMSKRERLSNQRELDKLSRSLSGIENMKGLPDALFIIDVGYENIAVSEAKKLNIPVVGVVDSNNSPEGIDYIIPGNDDSMRSICLYVKGLADAIIDGRLAASSIADVPADEFLEVDKSGEPIVQDPNDKVFIKQKSKRKKIVVDNKEALTKNDAPAKDEQKNVQRIAEAGNESEKATKVSAVGDIIRVFRQPEKPYRANTARAQYWERINQFDGKAVEELKMSIADNPPSLTGKSQSLSSFLNFFSKQELIKIEKNKQA